MAKKKKDSYEDQMNDATYRMIMTLWQFRAELEDGPMPLILQKKDVKKAETLYEVLDLYTQLYFKTRELATGLTANIDPSWKSEGV